MCAQVYETMRVEGFDPETMAEELVDTLRRLIREGRKLLLGGATADDGSYTQPPPPCACFLCPAPKTNTDFKSGRTWHGSSTLQLYCCTPYHGKTLRETSTFPLFHFSHTKTQRAKIEQYSEALTFHFA